MRGFMGCDFGPFGRHCQDMGPFGHHGPFERFGCEPPRHFGPHGHQFGPPGHHFGPPELYFGPPGHGRDHHGFGSGPHFGAEAENCCGYGRGTRGEDREPHSPPCGRPCGHSRERSPRRRHRSPGPVVRGHGPCHGPPHEGKRHHSRGRCHGSPPGHSRPCDRRDHGDESGPEGPHGHHHHHGPMGPHGHHKPGPFGPHYGGRFGPHRRPFGPCNRQGPYDQCQRNNSDEESGNETDRRGWNNRPCCKKNKDQNREEAILVQRIVVEKAPRCNSV